MLKLGKQKIKKKIAKESLRGSTMRDFISYLQIQSLKRLHFYSIYFISPNDISFYIYNGIPKTSITWTRYGCQIWVHIHMFDLSTF